MRLVWRRIPPHDFNHELVWLAVSVAAAIGGAIWLRLGLPTLRCPFLALTGYPCLTCGATRCAIALAHGSFSGAWLWNPLAMVALSFVVVFDVYAAIILVTRAARPRLTDWTRAEKTAVRIAVIILIGVNWIYLLAHHAQF
jgi:hypothetical protein